MADSRLFLWTMVYRLSTIIFTFIANYFKYEDQYSFISVTFYPVHE